MAMQERRIEPRLLCADLVPVEWKDRNGRSRRATANLEDISISGACLQLDYAIPVNTIIRITYSKGILEGTIRYCVYREIGYYLGIQFEQGNKWAQRKFKPQHLFDPRRLTAKARSQAGSSLG
jgi:hypothetical protein